MIIPNPPLLTSVALTIEQGHPVSFGLEADGGDNCISPCSTQAIPPSFNARVTSPSCDGVDTGRGKVRADCGSVRGGVAGEAEPAPGVLGGDGGERGAERLLEGLLRAGADRAQARLELGPGPLDGVEVGRVGREIAVGEPGAVERP